MRDCPAQNSDCGGEAFRYPRSTVAGRWLLALAALSFLLIGGLPAPASAAGLNGDKAYTEGPQVCAQCHAEAFEAWLNHGHSRKLGIGGPALKALDGRFGLFSNARDAGFRLPDHNKELYNWDNIAFVVGASKRWKTRFVGKDGFIITKGGQNQYNWGDGSWSNYHKDEEKPYSCGSCHTTGYRKDGKAFANGMPGTKSGPMPGIEGDWAQFNITCEACHGPGDAHAKKPAKANIKVDKSAKLCGTCHVRGSDPNTVIASGGFIRHHEQYPELANSPHKKLQCVTCHTPHAGRAGGTKVSRGADVVCEKCHAKQRKEFTGSPMQKAGVSCIDCHMARATKSAIAVGPYEGDVRTHIMRINPAADYVMFTADGKAAKDAISLEYACLPCHAAANKAEFATIKNYHTIGK